MPSTLSFHARRGGPSAMFLLAGLGLGLGVLAGGGSAQAANLLATSLEPQQPSGIPLPPAPNSPAAKPTGIPGVEPAATPGKSAGGKPPAGKPMSGSDYEKLEGVVIDSQFHIGPAVDGIPIKLLIEAILDKSDLKNVIVTDRAIIEKEIYLAQKIILPVQGLRRFLETILDQNGAALVKDGDLYFIQGKGETTGIIDTNPLATTQVIPTKGLRPSALQQAIQIALKGGSGGPGPAAGGQGGTMPIGGSIAFLDDLGVILMTDTPRRITQVRSMVQLLVEEQSKQTIEKFELRFVTASVARTRLLELLGRQSGGGRTGLDPNAAANAAAIAAATGQSAPGSNQALSNIADRLIPDPTSNVLVFRGRPDETAFIASLLKVIDTPNQLRGQFYAVGVLSEQLATLGKGEGLGEIVQLPSSNTGLSGNRQGRGGATEFIQQGGLNGGGLFGQRQQESLGGPMFVLDPEGRGFMYFGTEDQQKRVGELARQFAEFAKTTEVTFEFYKLRHARAEDTAEVIRGLISNQVPSSGLIGSGRSERRSGSQTGQDGSRSGSTSDRARRNRNNTLSGGSSLGGGGGGNTSLAGLTNDASALQSSEEIFVLADTANNQIVVKAPKQVQPQFQKLIDRLDLRRPQVYIDAKIVAVTARDEFRLAIETQILAMGDATGVVNTGFGLGSLTTTSGTTTTGGITSPKVVNPSLSGITAAIIRSDQVPIILTALARDTSSQILATPQLLVDDNETAEVSSLEQQPTTTQTTSSSAGSTLTGFGGFEDAGPKLTVTPQISEGNYLKLSYEIELSNFTGTPTTTSTGSVIPAGKLENKISSDSVTVPSDSTIVVGGLTFEQRDNTVVKVPFLGDIPILGQLFKDDNKTNVKRTLYIFITPRIMRDPGFGDLRLLSQGPAKTLNERDRGLPTSAPARIEITPQGLPRGADGGR